MPEANNIEAAACFDDLANDIKDSWVSLSRFSKADFIPLRQHIALKRLSVLFKYKGSIMIAIYHEITILHKGPGKGTHF